MTKLCDIDRNLHTTVRNKSFGYAGWQKGLTTNVIHPVRRCPQSTQKHKDRLQKHFTDLNRTQKALWSAWRWL